MARYQGQNESEINATGSLNMSISQQSAAVNASQSCLECIRKSRCIGGLLVEGMPVDQASNVAVCRMVVDKGEHLYRADDKADHVYVVRGGALKTYVTSLEGDEEIRGFHLAEEVAGLDAICQPSFRSSARALSRTWVCRLPIAAVRSRMLESGSFRDRILANLGREFDRLNGMLHRERCTADQRVASFLMSQLKGDETEKTEIQLPMSRVDLARYLDLATETVSRVFTRFQARNILRSQGAVCEVVDRDALSALA